MSFLPNLANAKAQKQTQLLTDFNKALIHHEAKIGGKLFGPVPEGTRREFFCLDLHTWVWHEEWTDKAGKRRVMTTRYDIRPDGVLKSQGGRSYRMLKGEEYVNFRKAVDIYSDQVLGEYDKMLATA